MSRLLDSWGVEVTLLEEPQQFWPILRACCPDLLMLEMDIPYGGGIELCQQLRTNQYWCDLPIIVLTADTQAVQVQQLFAAGASDFVSKPIVGPELRARLQGCLQQTQGQDFLTKVMDRHASMPMLKQRLQAAQAQQTPFYLAVLRIKGLRQINAQYGLDAGDAVLSSLGGNSDSGLIKQP
ncbi:MAG: response regulator [Acaryochloridaceae cyanobacterium SU_2_1]|nr:response regulator [Acaryochloridaceae cyanobacterium SU_2_1]